jgi:hypothetical protein
MRELQSPTEHLVVQFNSFPALSSSNDDASSHSGASKAVPRTMLGRQCLLELINNSTPSQGLA